MTIGAIADRLLGMMVPKLTAAADHEVGHCRRYTLLCYCSGGLAYRRICDACRTVAGVVHACTGCQVTGTC